MATAFLVTVVFAMALLWSVSFPSRVVYFLDRAAQIQICEPAYSLRSCENCTDAVWQCVDFLCHDNGCVWQFPMSPWSFGGPHFFCLPLDVNCTAIDGWA